MAKKLSEEISVSPQIKPSDVAGLAQLGFRSIICNRPDGESPDQPAYRGIAAAAADAGLAVRYVPVASTDVSVAEVAAFAAAMDELPKPVLAYCRSGTRSAVVWSKAEEKRRSSSKTED